ncbi:MAG: ATP-binding protein [Gammaproteobacteria bacterium]|nr:ATP-binding protein [Gammaproteobacteria bacterium]
MKLLDEFRQGTLFAKTTITITVTSFLFIAFTLSLLAFFIVIPTAERSAKELTTNLFLAADMWHQSADEDRHVVLQFLKNKYEVGISQNKQNLVLPASHSPFFYLVKKEIERRTGKVVPIYETFHSEEGGSLWAEGVHTYWIPLTLDNEEFMVSFRYGHANIDPPFTILIIMLVGLLATLFTSLILARRLTKPLEQLSSAAKQLGKGGEINQLPVHGPNELVELVQSFNTMSHEIQDLLANRTTLLTGISHDLRTPLTRMELALEMLSDSADPTLLKPLHRDIEQMNRLIGLFLEISQEMHEEKRQMINIVPLLTAVVEDHRRSGAEIDLDTGYIPLLMIHPLALQRIVNNLLENAIRYGAGNPIKVVCKSQVIDSSNVITIDVMDRGQGIPESELEAVFRPFHRLDKSRNSHTEGSGLGLSITRQLAQANGCRVELLPRDGGGTIARISINLSK